MDDDHFTAHSRRLERDATNSEGISITEKRSANVWLTRIGILAATVGILALLTFASLKFSEKLGIGNYFVLAANFLTSPTDKVASFNGRTNILVMGRSGGSHDGPDLTDTILLVSVGLDKPGITIVSLPRDLWIPEIRAKINSAYYWGKNGSPYLDVSEMGGGISFSKIVAGEVVGKPIQYGIIVDFTAFKDIIDALGGIKVDVANSFTDKLYPIAGKENDTCGGDPTFACRYQTVTFSSGPQTMNGDTALIFVRSRHAEGVEGSDLAREARQQKVVDAIKDKISSPMVFLSPRVDLALLSVLKKYVESDLTGPTAAIIARKAIAGRNSISQFLIPEELLVSPPINAVYDQQSVFIPKAGSGKWGDINKWFASVLP